MSLFFREAAILNEIVTIILNWNKADMTIRTFKNIKEIEKSRTDFIIIDNGSEENEKEKLINYAKRNNWKILKEDDEISENLDKDKNKSINVILYILNKNYGYAKGNNFGLKLANLLGYNYAIIANNDVILEEEVIEKLLQVILNNEDVCVVGPIFKLFKLFYARKIKYNKIIFPYRLMGCFMLVKIDCMKKINFFDENTFLYAEELILAEKLKSIGKKTAYRDDVYVKHLHGVSTIEHGEKKRFLLQLESDLYYL